jgi:hypothetical protein
MPGFIDYVRLANGGGHLFRPFKNRTRYQAIVQLLSWTVLYQKEQLSMDKTV